MKQLYKNLFFIFIAFSLYACTTEKNNMERLLNQAGANRSELEKVLSHYKANADPLKLQAAKFLIENMPYYYSYKKNDLIDTLKTLKSQSLRRLEDEVVEKWKHVSYYSMPKIYDVHVITAEYLINNIDFSFQVWNSCSWSKNYSFEEFCEYILPYRIKDEPLEEWRTVYYNKYKPILDSLYQGTDIVEAAKAISNYLKSEQFYNQKDWELPHLGASYLFQNRVGSCREACDITIYTMRSLGIPVATDEYITSPSYSGKHFWTSIIDTTKKAVPFIYNENELSRYKFDDRDKGKLYRTYFGAQPEKVKGLYADKDAPTLFRSPFYKDVSSEYFENEFEINIRNEKGFEYVYLSVFRSDGWQAIDVSKAGKQKAIFSNVENNLIYQPIFYQSGYVVEAGYPFILIDSQPEYFVPDINEVSNVALTRKYPVTSTLKTHLASATGVKIEGASRSDSKDAVLLYHVTDTLNTIHNTIYLPEKNQIRYITYTAPDTKKIELAELWCYPDSTNDNGYEAKITGIPELTGIHRKITSLIVDNDFVSYYMSADKGEKLIFDFGKPVSIRKIFFSPRNDDNFIHIGDSYELFYHGGQKGWISLGKQKALGLQLYYENVPANALLWLHDETRGKEEQVFYYKDGKQIFAYDL